MLLNVATSTNGFKVSKADNFAHFTVVLPGYFLLFSNDEDGPHGQPLHSSDYDFNDALLPIGASL